MEGGFLAAFLTSFTPQTVTSPQLWYTHPEDFRLIPEILFF